MSRQQTQISSSLQTQPHDTILHINLGRTFVADGICGVGVLNRPSRGNELLKVAGMQRHQVLQVEEDHIYCARQTLYMDSAFPGNLNLQSQLACLLACLVVRLYATERLG